jgi:ABC-type Mn2+/Zn2+ transport system permease subunit
VGETISHSVLPGVAIAFIDGANIFIGAFIAGVVILFFQSTFWMCDRVTCLLFLYAGILI